MQITKNGVTYKQFEISVWNGRGAVREWVDFIVWGIDEAGVKSEYEEQNTGHISIIVTQKY